MLFRSISGTRLILPTPVMAWILLILGAVLIALGTLCATRVRRHMVEEHGLLTAMVINPATLGYLLSEYDEDDKWLMLIGMSLRAPGTIGVLWGLVGIAYT